MRCQWGTTWDNMQPWISARRFREFDRLDYDVCSVFIIIILISVIAYVVAKALISRISSYHA